MEKSSRICTRFFDEIPQNGRRYFLRPPEGKIVAIIIPFYNENWEPLWRTIESLERCQRYLRTQTKDEVLRGYTFVYCFIQDGWKFADESVKEKLKEMFPNKHMWQQIETWTDKDYKDEEALNQDENIKEGKKEMSLHDLNLSEVKETKHKETPQKDKVTYIFQSSTPGGQCAQIQLPGTELSVHMSLVVKKDNRKKHNSHQWFFSTDGYCGAMNPEFCFATDCSTLFEEDCLFLLLKKMLEEKKCVVCTGRQVVMDSEMQGNKDTLLDSLYRNAQRYDFESSFLLVGAFQLFGFLPVVPGPCGLYRWEYINPPDGPLDWYFKIVNTPSIESGLILSNLKIAEDRILSYAAVLKAKVEVKMCAEVKAEFYFEAETDLGQFVKQRRRWINGTLAGYLYLLANTNLIFNSEMGSLRNAGVFLLILLQAIICLMTQLTPSIFLCALYSILMVIFGVSPKEPFAYAMIQAVYLAVIALYIYFVVRHAREGDENTFVGWMFYVLLFFSMNVVVMTITASILHMVTKPWKEDGAILSTNWLLVISYSVMLLPQIFNFNSPRSILRSTRSFIPFCLFLPMLISWFSSYAAARFWDVSWGNRPSQAVETHASSLSMDNKLKIVKAKIYSQAFAYVLLLLLANLLVVLVYVFNLQSPTFILSMVIFIASFQVIYMLTSGIFFVFNIALYRAVVQPLQWGLAKLLPVLPKNDYDIIGHEMISTKTHMFQLGFFQMVINLSYQFIFQSLTYELKLYDKQHFEDYNIHSIGFPIMGLLYIFVAFGDRKSSNFLVYKLVMLIGVIAFVLGTSIILGLLFIKNISGSSKYWLLLSQAYIQFAALNLIASSTSCLFLLYASHKDLLQYIVVRSILGACGNLIPSIMIFAAAHFNDTVAIIAKNVVLCLANVLGVIVIWRAVDGPPHQQIGSRGEEGGVSKQRLVAIVLVTLFMFTFGLSPIQFELKSYFDDRNVPNSYVYSSVDFIIQEVVVILAGVLTTLTPMRKKLKGISVFFGITSLLQIIFLTPLGDKWIVGFALVAIFGLYRTYVDVFAYYFFARDIQDDSFHIGFWVAVFNTTIIVAEGMGYNLLSIILYNSGVKNMKWLFGGSAIANFLGLAIAWRIAPVRD